MEKTKKTAIEFAEWIQKKRWAKMASLPNDVYKEMVGWYNTHNYEAMKQPISTEQLFDLYEADLEDAKRHLDNYINE